MKKIHLIIILVTLTTCILSSCTRCASNEEIERTATPVYLSSTQKARFPFRTINRIYFLVDDSTQIRFDNVSHNIHLELQGCRGDGDCGDCETKNEFESHKYVANGYDDLIVYHKLIGGNWQPNPVFGIQFEGREIAVESDLLDSIPYLDSIQINGKIYKDIYRLIRYDTVLYNREYGILQINSYDHKKLELIRIE